MNAGRVPKNVARGVPLPSITYRSNVYLTYEQVEHLASLAGPRRLPIYLAAYVGMRWGEIHGLQPEDVDLELRRITIRRNLPARGDPGPPKGGEARTVGYPAFLDSLMATAVAEGMFPWLTTAHPDGWWGTLRKRAGMPAGLHFHDLRHSSASFAISSGAHPLVVANMLGHANPTITLRVYSDLYDSDVDDIAQRISSARAQNVPKTTKSGAASDES